MKQESGSRLRNTSGSAARFVLVLVCLGALGGAFVYRQARAPRVEPSAGDAHAAHASAAVFTTPTRHKAPAAAARANPLALGPTPARRPAPTTTDSTLFPSGETASYAPPPATPLPPLDLTPDPLTPEQAAVWKENVKRLAAQGPGALPAIQEFLRRNLDVNFAAMGNGSQMGSPTLRLALLDAMQQIGGPEAIAASLQVLQTTADPVEIATLAHYLEQSLDAAQHREVVLTAAREALSLAASGQWDGRDVAPLFDVLRTYGGTQAVADFETYAGTWFNYAPLMLAQLPDGAGIPALIRFVQAASGPTAPGADIYQRMLAQVSAQSTDAAEALLAQVRADRIPPAAWPGVASALAGTTLQLERTASDPASETGPQPGTQRFHIAAGNQNYVEAPAPADMTPSQVQERIGLIDTLLDATSNPAAITYLRSARNALNARLASAGT